MKASLSSLNKRHNIYGLLPLTPIFRFFYIMEKMGKVGYPRQLQKWITSLQLVFLHASGFFSFSSHGSVKWSPLAQPVEEVHFPVPLSQCHPTGWCWLDPSAHHTLLCTTPKDVQLVLDTGEGISHNTLQVNMGTQEKPSVLYLARPVEVE